MKTNSKTRLFRATLCYFMRSRPHGVTEVLLAIKRKKIGKDKRNGHGGGIKKGETSAEAAQREVYEETRSRDRRNGVKVKLADLKHQGLARFHTMEEDGSVTIAEIDLYIAWKWKGRFHSNDEMWKHKWFPVNRLPKDELMEADKYWLYSFLYNNTGGDYEQRYLVAAKYGPKQKDLLNRVILTEVNSLTPLKPTPDAEE
jgi:8-oxo-dGTP pyrophosphatase MutT (NUDIX family)